MNMPTLPILMIAICLFCASETHAAEAKIISQSMQSWDGGKLEYPKGEAQVSVVRITINAGDKLDFHCHPVPSAGYIVSGDLEVQLKDGTAKQFHKGDVITEVVHRLHRGVNLSKSAPVELIVFYAGAKDVPLTIHSTAPDKDCTL